VFRPVKSEARQKPESIAWLAARKGMAGARSLSHRTGVPLPAAAAMAPGATAAKPAQAIRSGFAGVLGRHDL
jgi:hypothetical protein